MYKNVNTSTLLVIKTLHMKLQMPKKYSSEPFKVKYISRYTDYKKKTNASELQPLRFKTIYIE